MGRFLSSVNYMQYLVNTSSLNFKEFFKYFQRTLHYEDNFIGCMDSVPLGQGNPLENALVKNQLYLVESS